MRRFALTVLLILCFAGVGAAQTIGSARFAAVDLDSDGNLELIAGGLVGPFGPGAQGFLQIGEIESSHVRIVSDSGSLSVVRDLAVGRFGESEDLHVYTVGAGRLCVFLVDFPSFEPVSERALDSDWTDRISVLDDLVVVSEYEPTTDRDVGRTVLRGFETTHGHLSEVWSIELSAHVGDLALVGGATPTLVVETGHGDEGGDVLVYRIEDAPVLIGGERVTDGRRCRAVEASPGGRVIIQPMAQDARLFDLVAGRLIGSGRLRGSRSLTLVPEVPAVEGVRSLGAVSGHHSWSYRSMRF